MIPLWFCSQCFPTACLSVFAVESCSCKTKKWQLLCIDNDSSMACMHLLRCAGIVADTISLGRNFPLPSSRTTVDVRLPVENACVSVHAGTRAPAHHAMEVAGLK